MLLEGTDTLIRHPRMTALKETLLKRKVSKTNNPSEELGKTLPQLEPLHYQGLNVLTNHFDVGESTKL